MFSPHIVTALWNTLLIRVALVQALSNILKMLKHFFIANSNSQSKFG